MKKPKAPKNLKAEGRKFWNRVTAEYDFEAEHDFVRLAQAAGCLDVIKAAEEKVEAEGMFVQNRFHELREHPGLKVIRDNKIVFCRIVRELSLDLDEGDGPRPPRLY